MDSPTKSTSASETPRCAPPHTNRAGEEPCQGGATERANLLTLETHFGTGGLGAKSAYAVTELKSLLL